MDNIVYISTDSIYSNAYQPRKYFNENALNELAQSIKAYGIIQPITVRKAPDDRYELVAGERRLKAARIIGLREVPSIVIDITNKQSAAIALLENLQREDLNYMEEAEAYYNLIKEHGYTQEKLAEGIGKKQSTIANKLRLLKLSAKVVELLLKNNLTERHARALLKLNDESMQLDIVKIVIKKGLNVKKTEELVKNKLEEIHDKENNIGEDGKKRIKGVFSPKIYINTIKQVFDKYGIDAKYRSKELDDKIEVTVVISKKV
ncbi:chromosome partitioning protein ParB [Clostridium sp. DMHC 10]|nr:ParB/RepB/Spo0J family partition protein [Clostridium guangxiense]KOF57520.1 chromosome partitioning protein ParB [Clostridium sp. DMHC 10]